MNDTLSLKITNLLSQDKSQGFHCNHKVTGFAIVTTYFVVTNYIAL